MLSEIRGTGVALITPFNADGSVDLSSLERLVNHVIEGGVDYLVVLGTTGESVTLSSDEKKTVVNKVKEVNNGRVPLVLGYAGNNTATLLEGFEEIDFEGVDAILSATPAYNKPSQEGLYQHYKLFVEQSPVPVILYTVPGRTGVNMKPKTVLKLANEFPGKIIGVKEASGDLGQMMKIIKGAPKGFQVISGDDGLALPLIACGGTGLISVLANAFPKEMSAVVSNALENNLEAARENHYKILDLINLTFADGNPSGIKAMCAELGLIKNVLRLPLVPVNAKVAADIKSEIKKL